MLASRAKAPHQVHKGRRALFEILAGEHYRLHQHGNEILRVHASNGAEKVWRRNADDGEGASH